MNNNTAKIDYQICDVCGNKMYKEKASKTFTFGGKKLTIDGINIYKCEHCDNILYSGEEIEMIESITLALSDKPKIDMLNLSETANLLRVSNQTIYNMINAGRIKAYKIGREWKFLRNDIQLYLDNNSTDRLTLIAAKGGKIDKHDLEVITSESSRESTK